MGFPLVRGFFLGDYGNASHLLEEIPVPKLFHSCSSLFAKHDLFGIRGSRNPEEFYSCYPTVKSPAHIAGLRQPLPPAHNNLFLPRFLEEHKARQSRQLPPTKTLWHLSIRKAVFESRCQDSLCKGFWEDLLHTPSLTSVLSFFLFDSQTLKYRPSFPSSIFLTTYCIILHLPLSFKYICSFFWLFFPLWLTSIRPVTVILEAQGSFSLQIRKQTGISQK